MWHTDLTADIYHLPPTTDPLLTYLPTYPGALPGHLLATYPQKLGTSDTQSKLQRQKNEGVNNRSPTRARQGYSRDDPFQDILIRDRYRVDRKIGQGGFGLVYSGAATYALTIQPPFMSSSPAQGPTFS